MEIVFSIIIPVYNRRNLVKATIDSILVQTYKNLEVIIIDDGSTDNTGEFIKREFTDPRVRYFYKTNEERGAARNFGLQKATGNYAVFLDSDDLMKTNYLATLFEIITEHPDYCFVATKYNFLYPNGEQVPSAMHSLKEGFYDFNYFLKGNELGCNFCIRLIDFEYKLFPPERELASMEDWLFVLLNTRQQPIFIKDIICVHMKQHDERSMMQNQLVIKARRKATEWVLKNFTLSSAQTQELKTWSHYFYAVHQYLDGRRRESVKEILNTIRFGGLKANFIIVLIKSIVGKKLIRIFK